jgi:paraquat-inducible protein B
MAEPPKSFQADDLPAAVIGSSGRRKLPLVWIIPIVAALIGGYLAVKAILEKGPTATITFVTAEGIEAGKTKILYRNVEIGQVNDVGVSEDEKRVIATVEFKKSATKFLVKDTRFWVVRPRVGAGGVSGLGTLFSGAYLGVDLGKSTEPQHAFTGLEAPPIVTADSPGRQFILHSAEGIGSLEVGSPIYFRHIEVGRIAAFVLDPDGNGVKLWVVVFSPYERYVTPNTRFWNASGVDMTVNADGLRVHTESVASIIAGGIAFEDPPDATQAAPAEADTKFDLAVDRVQAMKRPDNQVMNFVMYFDGSLRGLSPGAPIDFNGLTVGEVKQINLEYDPTTKRLLFPVSVEVYPDRLRARQRKGAPPIETPGVAGHFLDNLVAQGYRAQLRSGNILTGQLYIAFDRFPNAPKATVNRSTTPVEIPTTPGTLQELTGAVTQIAAKIEKLPLEELTTDAHQAMQTLNSTLASVDQLVKKIDGEVTPEVQTVLQDAHRTLETAGRTLQSDSPTLIDLRQAMSELTRAAEAVRVLAEMLDKQPESLIRGKKGDQP